MKKELIVLSLGGSLIIPDKINTKFLKNFKKLIQKHTQKYKFIIVCGGGKIARKYIKSLKEIKTNKKFQSYAGISATRMNARFLNYFFNFEPLGGIPHSTGEIKKFLKKRNIVFCGGLDYSPNQTSDTTAAKLAKKFSSNFINLTNVDGLFNKDPKKHKDAKLIPKISWENFDKIVNRLDFEPGQHFVLDQLASKIIKKEKIRTTIVGPNLKNLDNLLNKKPFKGTIIEN